MTISRREMLLAGATVGAMLAAGVVVPVSFILSEDDAESSGATGALLPTFPRTRVGSLSELSSGEPQFFDYPLVGQPNIIVKLSSRAMGGVGVDHDIVAFSNACTHMGCPITEYQSEHNVLGPCPCHFTTFDLSKDGEIVLGQATEKLPRLLLEVDGDEIFAEGVFRLVYGHHNTLGGISAVAAG